MPVWRYFLFTGSVLLALMFIADAYLPAAPSPRSEPEVDHAFIRVHANRVAGGMARDPDSASVAPLISSRDNRP